MPLSVSCTTAQPVWASAMMTGSQRATLSGKRSGLSRVKWISANSHEGVLPGARPTQVGSTRHSREPDIVAPMSPET